MQYLSAEPPFVEVEVEEKNEKGRVINTIYKMVQEEGPRRVATIDNNSDAQELAAPTLTLTPTPTLILTRTPAPTQTPTPTLTLTPTPTLTLTLTLTRRRSSPRSSAASRRSRWTAARWTRSGASCAR